VELAGAGFDAYRPAVVSCIGVSMYLSRAANEEILRQAASLAPGSVLVLMFLPPLDQVEPADRAARRASERGARASGTPFVSFFSAPELVVLAREAGFAEARHVRAATLNERYFAGRPDGLRVTSGAELLVATCGPQS